MRKRSLLAATSVVGAVFATVGWAAAPSVSISTFHSGAVSSPQGITFGPDGAIWFTNEGGHSIGRITPHGVLRTYTDPSIATPTGITSGPDGALWFLNETGSIGRITVTGRVTSFPAFNDSSPVGIAAGPDGAIWFTTAGEAVGRMTTLGAVTMFDDPLEMRGTYGITSGPDGALWFTNYLGSSIGRISVDGVVSSYTDPRIRYPVDITTGPDGALWFTDDSGSIGRITTSGVVSTYGDASTVGHPLGIILGGDGALWATDRGGSIVRITTSGSITRYNDPAIQFPVGITAADDGSLWFTNYTDNSIGRVELVPATPEEPTPRVTIGWAARAHTASVVRSTAVAVVRVPLRVDRSASLVVTVRNPRTGLDLRLEPGSRVAATTLTRRAVAVSTSISGARTFVVEAVLAVRGLTPGWAYQLVIDAVGATGKRTEARFSFRG